MGVAAAILGAGVLSAAAQIFGSKAAAGAQTDAATKATEAQLAMFGITRASLAPFITAGSGAANILNGRPGQAEVGSTWTKDGHTVKLRYGVDPAAVKAKGWTMVNPGSAAVKAKPGMLGELIKPISMTQADLEATPGYKFTLAQGTKAAQNAAGARGLGASGAAIKGATEYTTGLSDKTYNERFANELVNKTFAYNTLIGTAGLGANAAAGLGGNAVQTGGNIGSNLVGAGNAQAGANIAGANAATDFGNSLVAALLQAQKAGNQNVAQAGVF